MQPITELDDQDPEVFRHRDQHLAEGGGLLGFFGVEADAIQLGHTVDDRRHLVAERPADVLELDPGVLHRIVEQRGGDRHLVEPQIGHDPGHGQRVDDVRLTGLAALGGVGPGRHLIGTGDDLDLGVAVLTGETGHQRLDLRLYGATLATPRQYPFNSDHVVETTPSVGALRPIIAAGHTGSRGRCRARMPTKGDRAIDGRCAGLNRPGPVLSGACPSSVAGDCLPPGR